MDTRPARRDEVAQFLMRSRRSRILRIATAIVLAPVLLLVSYVGSIGTVCLANAAGISTENVPGWYAAPLNFYVVEQGPGWLHIVKFAQYCSWLGEDEHTRTWDEEWSEIEREILETAEESASSR